MVDEKNSTDIVWSVVDGEAMLLDASLGDYFSLNPLATEVWQLLCAGEEAAHIIKTIAEKYEIQFEIVRTDVSEFIEQLRAAKLWAGAEGMFDG